MIDMQPEESDFRAVKTDQLETKPFIAWDGEGINLKGEGKPQSYVLFGSSDGYVSNKEGLNVWDCLEYIIDVGRRFPERVSRRIRLFLRREHDNPTPFTKHARTIAPARMG